MKSLFLLIFIALLVSCESAKYNALYSTNSLSSPKEQSLMAYNKLRQDNPPSSNTSKPNTERKTYYEAYMTLDVSNVDKSFLLLKESMNGFDAYILSSSKTGIIFRVKSEKMESFIAKVTNLGDVKKKNIIGQDVTEQFEDLKIQLENANGARDKYMKLLEKAATVDEILKVEKELERITEKIELLEGKFNRINQIVSYSLVSVELEEKVTPGPLGWVFYGLYKGIAWLFVW